MARRNRKTNRRGKVVIPDLLANLGDRTARFTAANRRGVKILIKLVMLALIVYFFAAGPHGSVRLYKLFQQRQQLEAEDRRLTAEVVYLENIRYSLEVDTTYIEQVARVDYGFSKPNEIIYSDPPPADDK